MDEDAFVVYRDGYVDPAKLRKDAAALIRDRLLPALPPTPALNKWTKQGPSNDFWVKGMLFGIMRRLARIAFGNLAAVLQKKLHNKAKASEARIDVLAIGGVRSQFERAFGCV